jgi:hypothetical protein
MSGEDMNVMRTVSEEDVPDETQEFESQENDDDKRIDEHNNNGATAAFYGEETASSSQVDDEEDEEDIEGVDESDDDDSWPPEDVMASMPLFKYVRLSGSLPRHTVSEGVGEKQNNYLSVSSTCAAIGRVIVSPDVSSLGGSNNPLSTAMDTSKHGDDNSLQLLQRRMLTDATPHYIMLLGFENGKLWLVDVPTGSAVIASDQLQIREGKPQQQSPVVVDVSLDNTASVAGAIDQEGTTAIWEFKYSTTTVARPSAAVISANSSMTSDAPVTPPENVFASIMSAWSTPAPPKPNASPSTAAGAAAAGRPEETTSNSTLRLVASLTQIARINYPKSFGRPTCLAIDPGYKRKRDKCLLVGFADGRLVFTKRGFFQRRNDAVIYQGAKTTDGNYLGIEALAWRGPLVAWADARYDYDLGIRTSRKKTRTNHQIHRCVH